MPGRQDGQDASLTSDACDNGFVEAVALVADAGQSARRLAGATGYVAVHGGPVAPPDLALLGLEPHRSGEQVLLRHPQSRRGAIRLIALDGPPEPRRRDGAQAWDTGGIFDVNLRALPSIEALHAAFSAHGFHARAPITDWEFGSFCVREVVEDDADGLCIALMERVRPPLTGFESLSGPASWVFNSTQIVPDFDQARHFYRDVLGWQAVQETDGMAAGPGGHNCMGLPLGLAGSISMRIGIYQSQGRMEGSVEIIAYGCGALDFSQAAPSMRGWASLRLVVSDLAGLVARVCAADPGLIAADVRLPTGRRAVAIVTPWGARLEFHERQAVSP